MARRKITVTDEAQATVVADKSGHLVICPECGSNMAHDFDLEDGTGQFVICAECEHWAECPGCKLALQLAATPIRQPDGSVYPFWANIYEVDRHYGGPEEGGWWFDAGYLQVSVPCTSEQQATEVSTALLQGEYRNTGRSVSSIIYSGGQYRGEVSEFPGADYPTTCPHYE